MIEIGLGKKGWKRRANEFVSLVFLVKGEIKHDECGKEIKIRIKIKIQSFIFCSFDFQWMIRWKVFVFVLSA